ncbi:hypothetical protein [Qipengyuania flava]|nr:hypothetical protein [Qipengyuania flava]
MVEVGGPSRFDEEPQQPRLRVDALDRVVDEFTVGATRLREV